MGTVQEERLSWRVDVLVLAAWAAAIVGVWTAERGWLGRGVSVPRMIHAPLEVQEQWFGVYYQGRKVGFAHQILSPGELDGVPGFGIIDQGWMRFNLLGNTKNLNLYANAFVDAQYSLRNFSASIRSEDYRVQITGRRRGDVLDVTITGPASAATHRVHDPTGQVWISGLSPWASFQRLRVGQHGELWLLNPLALKPERLFFHVVRQERVEEQNALVIESDFQGMITTTWVTPEGRVLKELSPLGWELRQETSQEAIQINVDQEPADLLVSTSVPVDRELEPLSIARVVLDVSGLACADITVPREPWQSVHALEPAAEARRIHTERSAGTERVPAEAGSEAAVPACRIELRRPHLTAGEGPAASVPSRYRAPSVFIQSNDPTVRATARQIVGDETDPWRQAQALEAWVYQTLVKRMTIGLPSTLDVLAMRVGDCHEHTVLFTGLARSLGLSTRMLAGLVYQAGRFYYHAWPEVWINGVWLPMDPTLGQPLADATHLGLLEAEGEELLALGRLVGRLSVQVVEADTRIEVHDGS